MHSASLTHEAALLAGLPRCRRCAQHRADVSPRSRVCEPCADASPEELAERILAPIHAATERLRRADVAAATLLERRQEDARRAIAHAASAAALEAHHERTGTPLRATLAERTTEPQAHGAGCDCEPCDLAAGGDAVLSPWPARHLPRFDFPPEAGE